MRIGHGCLHKSIIRRHTNILAVNFRPHTPSTFDVCRFGVLAVSGPLVVWCSKSFLTCCGSTPTRMFRFSVRPSTRARLHWVSLLVYRPNEPLLSAAKVHLTTWPFLPPNSIVRAPEHFGSLSSLVRSSSAAHHHFVDVWYRVVCAFTQTTQPLELTFLVVPKEICAQCGIETAYCSPLVNVWYARMMPCICFLLKQFPSAR